MPFWKVPTSNIKSKFLSSPESQGKAEILCGLLTTARQTQQPSATGGGSSAVFRMPSVPQIQTRSRLATFREVLSGPPPSCSVVRCNLVGTSSRKRHKFTNALLELSEWIGRRFSGYVMRREREYIEVLIVVPSTTEEQLGDLYQLLVEFAADENSFVFEERNISEYHRLRAPFRVIPLGREPNKYSDEEEEAVKYEVASSIDS